MPVCEFLSRHLRLYYTVYVYKSNVFIPTPYCFNIIFLISVLYFNYSNTMDELRIPRSGALYTIGMLKRYLGKKLSTSSLYVYSRFVLYRTWAIPNFQVILEYTVYFNFYYGITHCNYVWN